MTFSSYVAAMRKHNLKAFAFDKATDQSARNLSQPYVKLDRSCLLGTEISLLSTDLRIFTGYSLQALGKARGDGLGMEFSRAEFTVTYMDEGWRASVEIDGKEKPR